MRATVKATIPIPPSQCIWVLQTFIDTGSVSIEERIVAPVVVKPETLSKKASVKDGIVPEIIKGTAPKRLAKVHAHATTANPLLVESLSRLPLPAKKKITPVTQLAITGIRKARIAAVSPK